MKKKHYIVGFATFCALLLLYQLYPSAHAAEGGMWSIRCDKPKDGQPGHCEMFQRLKLQQTNQRLVEFAIGFPESKGKRTGRGIVVLPLGILLQPGVEMSVDDGQVFKFQVRYCNADGCFAFLNLNQAVLDMMKKGHELKVSFQSTKPQKIDVKMSLKGFTKALKEISP